MAINFRKFFCKGARKGSWWYRLCDCKRYPDKPVKPTKPDKPPDPPAPPNPPKPPDPPPPPPPKPRPPLRVRVKPSCYSLLTADGDAQRFLNCIREAVPEPGPGKLSTRIFLSQSWGTRLSRPLFPWCRVGTWHGAEYGRPAPVWDLGQWDEAYWSRFRDVLGWVREEIGHTHLVLLDFCSWKAEGWAKLLEPLYLNIQRYPKAETMDSKDDLEAGRIPGGIMGDGLKPHIAAYFARALAEAEAIMPGAIEWEPVNEFAWWDWPADFGLAWHRWAVETLIGLGVPRERIVVSPPEGYERALAGQAGIVSFHGHSTARDIRAEYHGLLNERVELSGDGGYRGSGVADYKGRRCASAEEAAEIARVMVARGFPSWEYFDFGLEGPSCGTDDSWAGVIANVDLFDDAPLRAFAEAAR